MLVRLSQARVQTLYGFERAAIDKDGESSEEPLLLCIEQVIAPRDRVAQGLLPCRCITLHWSTPPTVDPVARGVPVEGRV